MAATQVVFLVLEKLVAAASYSPFDAKQSYCHQRREEKGMAGP